MELLSIMSASESARLPTLTSILLGTMGAQRPQLSPLEQRLIEIAKELWPSAVILVRCKSSAENKEPGDLTAAVAVEGARIALAAAIEFEGTLREIRDALSSRDGNG